MFTEISTIDLTVVVVYLIAMASIGIYQARKIRSSGDYFAGGRKFNKFLMMMHALGSGTHADDPVGVTGAAYKHGMAGIWYTFVYLLATPFYWLIAPIFRRSRYLTTADFFRQRYSPGLAHLYSFMGIVTFTVLIATMLKGTATIASAVTGGKLDEQIAIIGMTVVFVIYGFAGGLIATVVTESIQGLLIVVMSLLLVPFGLMAVGGFTGLHELINDPSVFSLRVQGTELSGEVTPIWVATASILMLIGIVAQPHIMEVCSTGKSEFEGRVGFTYGNMVKRLCAVGWAFTGVIMIAMAVQNPALAEQLEGHRELAFGLAMKELLPVGWLGLMFAAIFAAQMSSLSAFMVAASALMANNIYRHLFHPLATDKEILWVGRFSGLVIVVFGVLMASYIPSVVQALAVFWAISSLTGVLMWVGVLWRGANSVGGWASFLSMLVVWVPLGPAGRAIGSLIGMAGGTVPEWLGMWASQDHLQHLVLAYLPLGIIILVLVSLLTRPKPEKELDDFYTLIKTPVGQEGRLIEAGIPIVYAGDTTGHEWEQKHPRMVNGVGFLVAALVSLLMLLLASVLGKIGG